MTQKYQRPAGAFAGGSGLANRTKYQDDASATPKRAVSSAKVDGDINYVIDSLNIIDEASGARASINERLDVSLNADGTLKASVAGALDEWIVHLNAGATTRLDDSTFSMVGDWRGIYQVNRRVRLTIAGVALIGDIAEVSFAGGVTTITCVDLLDSNNYLGLIGAAPTQVAYGPLTAGLRGNSPRRMSGMKIPAGFDTYELVGVGSDLQVTLNGSPVSLVTPNGLAGYAPASVNGAALGADVTAKLVPVGVVVPFAGTAAPTGWLICAGQAVSRATYASLYLALGTAYGVGDGSTTFNVPDMRGRLALGMDNMGGTDAGRLSVTNTLGGSGGAQTKSGTTAAYTLTVADIPAHSHWQVANSGLDFVGAGGTGGNVAGQTSGSFSNGTSNQIPTRTTGGGAGHSHTISGFDVLPPYLLLNHIIKT